MHIRKPVLFWLRLSVAVFMALIFSRAPELAAAQSDGRTMAIHVVMWGDTLSTIASTYQVSPNSIADANRISQMDRLNVGQQLLVPNAIPANAPMQQSSGTHIVQPGEGLYRISLAYGVSVGDLMAANGIGNPDAIYAGQVLVIPSAGYSNSAPAPATGGSVPQAAGGTHVVQSGETLFRISQQYGVSVERLAAANGVFNPASIYAGQLLTIPGANVPEIVPPPASGTTQVTGTHVVQVGETLGSIAARYGISMTVIVQTNNLSNPSLLYVGQSLAIPGGGTTSGPAAQPAPSASTGGTYAVQPGDTLFRIAVQYGLTTNDLMVANGLGSADLIYTGQVLAIPNGSVGGPISVPQTPSAAPAPRPTLARGKQIVVVLSTQSAYAYENGDVLRSFVVSTGLPYTPTVQGDYSIYLKYDAQRMAGPGYDLPGVPWVMYFYQGYALHGTYWHNNFGHPMSHGCVNMRTDDALWLYQWAPVGTAVHVQW